MAPASTVTNITIQNLGVLQQGGSSNSATVNNASDSSKPWHREVWVEVVGGLIVVVIGFFIGFFIVRALTGDDDSPERASTASTPTSADTDTLDCELGPCVELTIEDTIVNGDDQGVYVRSTPCDEAERLTGVFSGTVIYGLCIVDDGLAVEGDTRWVKTPFDLWQAMSQRTCRNGHVATDGTFDDPSVDGRELSELRVGADVTGDGDDAVLRDARRMCPKVNERRKVPSVEGAITWNGNTCWVAPARSRSA